jgi:DNA-binding MarR family transcriptional regulator
VKPHGINLTNTSMHLIPLPLTRQPLLASLQQRRGQISLADFPALAVAASATTAHLDTEGETFAAVAACLETLARLGLSASSTRLLMLLVRRGPHSCVRLAELMKISSAAISQITLRLEMLSLITLTRGGEDDRRVVMITATAAARKVLASVVALTALGGAAAVLNQTRTPKKDTLS